MSGEIERQAARLDRERARSGEAVAAGHPAWSRAHDLGSGNPPPRKAGELDPEWVMCGVDVPAGKRLYASKDLKGSAFAVAMDQFGNGDGWHLTTTMCHMLVITRPTYAECMAELMRIWRNWENEGRELPAADSKPWAVTPDSREGQIA
jgi:hypothetical protein